MNKEFFIPTIVILLAIAFLDPFMLLMPSMLVYVLLALLLIVFSAFALLIFRESAQDEREDLHRAFAGRMAYIVGSGVLVLGIVYQVLILHEVDPILVVALAAMTLAKYVCVAYARKNL